MTLAYCSRPAFLATGAVLTLATAASGTAQAADCLKNAIDFAAQICGELERSGSKTSVSGDVNAQASLNSIIKKFVDASGTTNAAATVEKWEGLVQDEQLLQDRHDARGCRERMGHEALARCPKPAAMPDPSSSLPPSGPAAAAVPPAPAPAPMPRPPAVTASVQFGPRDYAYGPFKVAVAPCVQSGSALECDIRVTVAPGRNTGWMVDRGSSIQDEFGTKISPTWVTLQGRTFNPMNGGSTVQLTPGVSTLVQYHFDNVRDPSKLQAFSLTFCCTRNVPLFREN